MLCSLNLTLQKGKNKPVVKKAGQLLNEIKVSYILMRKCFGDLGDIIYLVVW